MRRLKLLPLLLVFCITALLVSVCSASAVMDPTETVNKANKKFNNLKNYHMIIDGTMSFCFGNKIFTAVITGESDIHTKPLLYKNTMKISMDGTSNKVEQQIVQYMEESDGEIIVYTNAGTKWARQYLPKSTYNPRNQYDNYLKCLKSATLVSEDETSAVFEVTIDGNQLTAETERILTSAGFQKMGMTADLFKDLGDFKYTITINKQTGLISKIDMDLSGMMAKIGSNIIDSKNIPDNQKTSMQEMFSSIKFVNSITFSEFNSVPPITIPKEAKDTGGVWSK